jgi:hypothetical protein
LQAQVVYYSVEVAAVHTQKLWPRSLTDDQLTKADKVALDYQAKEARAIQREHVQTHIHRKK